ncbi:hypothetical protein GC175_01855 [bacterium]|nr:hypothetical protein [bacterium]
MVDSNVLQHTQEYEEFLSNLDKLIQFVQFSKSLDPDATAVKNYRTSYVEDAKSLVLERAKEKVLLSNPLLVENPAKLASVISETQAEVEEEVWAERLSKYHSLRNELTVVQFVTIVEVYIYCLFKLLFKRQPQLMKNEFTNDHQMRYKELIAYESIDDLHEQITERITKQLMNKSIANMLKAIQKYCPKHVTLTEEDSKAFSYFWDMRNLIVHKGGIVDETFASNYSQTKGASLQLEDSSIEQQRIKLCVVLEKLDEGVYMRLAKNGTMSALSVETLSSGSSD